MNTQLIADAVRNSIGHDEATVWDRLFATYLRPQAERPPRYGLSTLTADSWQTVRGMLLTPLAARRQGAL